MSTLDPLIHPTTEAARREWIKYQLRLRGYSLASLAREAGVSRGVPKKALTGPYPKMERLIAEKLGLRPEQIWPERYRADGTPKSGYNERGIGRHPCNLVYRPKGTKCQSGGNVQPIDVPGNAKWGEEAG